MASRISQMRNGTPRQQQPLSESIEATRALMQQMKNSQNPQAILAQALEHNPNTAMIANMLKNGNSNGLEGIAKQIAQMKGYDINQVISQLQV